MSIYAIGDVQGCYTQLRELLSKLEYKSDKDRLWFVGDIVNRGPDSLKTMRFIKSLEDNAVCVLGNHDLHLLAVAAGKRKLAKKDTLQQILSANDSEQLLAWLSYRPLMHYQEKYNVCLVHAGIHPAWSKDQALACAREVETVLQGSQSSDFLANMYGDKPDKWTDSLTDWDRLRFITNCFTRMRYINKELKLCLKEKGSPEKQADNIHPWYELRQHDNDLNIVFGHWSTLKNPHIEHIYPVDTGCLWGGKLTALKVNKKMSKTTSIKCPKSQPIL